ncbi:MAG: hypothetical protein K2X31_10160 [Sphingopyxis sp.]|nr:hypothetical protein [Sphingopyxis sp.]
MTRRKIGFLFNHAAGHQAAHSLPIAAALSSSADVRIFVSGGAGEAEIRRLWEQAGYSGQDPRITTLRPASRGADWLSRLTGGAVPTDRVSILARNRELFNELDALVVPEKTSTLLKTRLGLDHLPLIHTRHGAGDRAIGFDKASARFDLVLMSGEKVRDRLAAAGLLKPDGHAIVGYPKFDTQLGDPDRSPLFDNDRPTILYNPHPSPALSSWYRDGNRILEWFAKQDQFNIVFAPHVMLFAKRWTVGLSPPSIARVPDIEAALRNHRHIRIDTGSQSSIDMTYTNRADIYLGDASSQVYEFLRYPRPCIFWDSFGQNWRDNPDFAHWTAGPVVHSTDELSDALRIAIGQPRLYEVAQQALFAYSFDLTSVPSAQRAADAILVWLDRRSSGEKAA